MVVRVSKADKVTAKLVAHHLKYMSVLGQEGPPLVPGMGDPLARVVFVLQEPHYYKTPVALFYPRVQNLFAKSLRGIGLHHSQVYVTAILKQRYHLARWTEAQIAAAQVLHRWEVDIVRPRVVVTLGSVIAEESWRHNVKPYRVVQTVHLSEALTRSSHRKLWYLDMERLKTELER